MYAANTYRIIPYRCCTHELISRVQVRNSRDFPHGNRERNRSMAVIIDSYFRENDLPVCGWRGLATKISLYRKNFQCLMLKNFSTANQWISALNLHLAYRMHCRTYRGKINFVSIRSIFKYYFIFIKTDFRDFFTLNERNVARLGSDYLGS